MLASKARECWCSSSRMPHSVVRGLTRGPPQPRPLICGRRKHRRKEDLNYISKFLEARRRRWCSRQNAWLEILVGAAGRVSPFLASLYTHHTLTYRYSPTISANGIPANLYGPNWLCNILYAWFFFARSCM